ncbi:hypothetical protein BZA05DRAFT_25711 [Tricharina praecox]|uniref:uncharacterized protein n=1 Tax=Tricharina praecox TaxID=43433 RepID=UPI00221F4004|nr:uncharacterized protein BZA05DRAFT_25711 [Tricharina praecox]KAI5853332.1 hypothetical protein BZA05DRAFT_25711 [Tricharina praecox]
MRTLHALWSLRPWTTEATGLHSPPHPPHVTQLIPTQRLRRRGKQNPACQASRPTLLTGSVFSLFPSFVFFLRICLSTSMSISLRFFSFFPLPFPSFLSFFPSFPFFSFLFSFLFPSFLLVRVRHNFPQAVLFSGSLLAACIKLVDTSRGGSASYSSADLLCRRRRRRRWRRRREHGTSVGSMEVWMRGEGSLMILFVRFVESSSALLRYCSRHFYSTRGTLDHGSRPRGQHSSVDARRGEARRGCSTIQNPGSITGIRIR